MLTASHTPSLSSSLMEIQRRDHRSRSASAARMCGLERCRASSRPSGKLSRTSWDRGPHLVCTHGGLDSGTTEKRRLVALVLYSGGTIVRGRAQLVGARRSRHRAKCGHRLPRRSRTGRCASRSTTAWCRAPSWAASSSWRSTSCSASRRTTRAAPIAPASSRPATSIGCARARAGVCDLGVGVDLVGRQRARVQRDVIHLAHERISRTNGCLRSATGERSARGQWDEVVRPHKYRLRYRIWPRNPDAGAAVHPTRRNGRRRLRVVVKLRRRRASARAGRPRQAGAARSVGRGAREWRGWRRPREEWRGCASRRRRRRRSEHRRRTRASEGRPSQVDGATLGGMSRWRRSRVRERWRREDDGWARIRRGSESDAQMVAELALRGDAGNRSG
jgi:hypothetical protein